MRILMVNTVCGVKSTGRICTDLAQALQARGHEVRIAYGRDSVPEEYQALAVPVGNRWEIYAHGLRAMLLDGAGLGSARATREFLRWVREFDPDVVHLHNLHGYYLNLPLLFEYLKESGKRVVWTLHDLWSFTGHSPACDQAGCEKWRSGCGGCPMKGDYPRSLTDFSRRNYNWKKEAFLGLDDMILVSPSDWLAALAGESFLGCYPVKVIPNGIDTEAFRPLGDGFKAERGLTGQKMLLAVAGNWYDTRKGLPDLLRLAERLPEGYRLVIAGLAPAQLRELPENILGLGKTDSVRALAELYSAADLLLNPTYSDNYPTVNLEALCCGTPVLTYRTGGSPECLLPGCGGAVAQGDLDAMLEEIPALCGQKAYVTAQSEALRRRFGKERAEREYLALYEA